MNASKVNRAIAAINLRNTDFWNTQQVLMEKRLKDEFIVENALNAMNSSRENLLPIYWKMPIEVALADAESGLNASKKYFAQKGGKAIKEDRLQKYIIACVQLNPRISSSQLLYKLTNQVDHDLVNDIEDEKISFNNGKDSIKNASVAGLKDRLSRAKKKLSSR